MPRPRKPTAVLETNGAFIHDPQRKEARVNEPKPDPCVGNAPRHLNKTQQAIWRELMSELPPQVATKADRKVVEVAVRMVERMRHNHTDECWAEVGEKNPRLVLRCDLDMTSSNYATLLRCLSQLGMTPADRSKIKVTEPQKVDEWDEFGAVN